MRSWALKLEALRPEVVWCGRRSGIAAGKCPQFCDFRETLGETDNHETSLFCNEKTGVFYQ